MGRGIAHTAVSVAMFGAVCTAQQAAAQQSESEGARGGGRTVQGEALEEIIVTARKTSENLQDVPVAVTAYSGEDLVRQNVRTLPEVAILTPGLHFAPALNSSAGVVIQMRGQTQLDPISTLDPSVGTYVDGVYWARAYGLNANMLDIQNFQALKGPQGTLFGRNTSGGAVLVTTNDPSFSEGFSGSLSATYGRFNHQALIAIMNVPIIDDIIAARLAFSGNKRDPYITEVNSGKKVQNLNDYTFRAKLLLEPSDRFKLLFSAERFHSNTLEDQGRLAYFIPNGNGALSGGLEQLGASPCLANRPACLALGNQILAEDIVIGTSRYRTSLSATPRMNITTQTYSVTPTIETSFGEIKGIGAYRRIAMNEYNTDNDGSRVRVQDGIGFNTRQLIDQWSGELTATGDSFANRLKYVLGVFYFDESGYDENSASSFTALGRLGTGGRRSVQLRPNDIKNRSWGVYGQGTFSLTDRLSITGGVRYSRDHKAITSSNGTFLGETRDDPTASFTCNFPQGCPFARSANFGSISYTASLEYKPTNDLLLYLKSAKGFRAGGQNLRGSGAVPASLQPFAPEITYSYEFGLKGDFLDRRLRVNAAVYYTRNKDIQRNTTAVVGTAVATVISNAATADIWGGEIGVNALLPGGFRIDATAAYTKPKYVEFIDYNGFDRSHEPFPMVSRWTATISPSWERDVAFGNVYVRADFAYQSRQANFSTGFYSDSTGIIRDASTGQAVSALDAAGFTKSNTDVAHILVNTRVGATIQDKGLELALWVKNLTNLRDYINSQPIVGLTVGRYMQREPRTYGVTATAKF